MQCDLKFKAVDFYIRYAIINIIIQKNKRKDIALKSFANLSAFYKFFISLMQAFTASGFTYL